MINKIKIVALLALAVAAVPAAAEDRTTPMLDRGTKELGLSGIIEFPDWDEVDFDLDITYGYFLRDGWEIGLNVLGSDVGGVERFDFSFFTEYNFNRDSNIVPFIGASVGLGTVSFDDGDFDGDTTLRPNDDNSTVFGIQGGVKWFVRPYMAISTAIAFNVSTDDIYQAGDSLEDNLTRFRIGLRYYF